MKRIVLILPFICFIHINAQKITIGNLAFLKSEKVINVSFDYSNVVFTFNDGEDEAKYVEREVIENGNEWKTEWETTKTKIKTGLLHSDFLKSFNLALYDNDCALKGGEFENADYTMVFIIQAINTGKIPLDDPYIISNVIVKTRTGEIVCQIDLKKTTGRSFSDVVGRIKTVYENIGKDLGEFIAKKVKKEKSK
jgi:hypothetical protein